MRLCASWADEYGLSAFVILLSYSNFGRNKLKVTAKAGDSNSNQPAQSRDRCLQC
jgi:hypothetical protein